MTETKKTIVVKEVTKDDLTEAKETAKSIRAKRAGKRRNSARRDVLAYPGRPGFMRRVVNDKPGRIESFKEDGWAIVYGDETGGEVTARDRKKPGTAVTKVVATDKQGKGVDGVLMEIPTEIFEEDKRTKMANIKDAEQRLTDKKREFDHPASQVKFT